MSGQTIEVLAQNTALAERVRLIGIDAPDAQQLPWGSQAQQRLTDLTQGQTVLLELDAETTDGYGRRLAYLWKDNVLVNEQLVAEGLALAVSRSPNTKYDQRLLNAQIQARTLGLGIWNPDQPMRQLPDEFREQQP